MEILKSVDTRSILLEGAARAFARHGYDRTRVDEIVQSAGTAKGTFYLHFASKEAVFCACLEGLREQYALHIPATGVSLRSDDASQTEFFHRLRIYCDLFQGFAKQHREQLILLSQAEFLDEPFRSLARDVKFGFDRPFLNLLHAKSPAESIEARMRMQLLAHAIVTLLWRLSLDGTHTNPDDISALVLGLSRSFRAEN